VPASERLAAVRLAEPGGTLLAGGSAVAAVLGVRPLGRLLDPAYALVARARGRLGRLVPDGPAPRRYP